MLNAYPRCARAGLALATLLLGACVATPSSERVSAAARRDDDCMFTRSLRDWRPLDDQNLILFESGRHRAYHVELLRPAFGLRRDIMIGVFDRDGRICPYGGDAIIVDGPMPDRVTIRSMKRLSDDELDALYVQYGIRRPAIVDTESVEIETESDQSEE